jgi:tRNA G26 N,N-dimethylase Trm1
MSDHIPDGSKMDTPRTDTHAGQIKLENEDSCCGIYVYIDGKEYYGSLVDADFARQLERELNQVTKERDEAMEWIRKNPPMEVGFFHTCTCNCEECREWRKAAGLEGEQ